MKLDTLDVTLYKEGFSYPFVIVRKMQTKSDIEFNMMRWYIVIHVLWWELNIVKELENANIPLLEETG